MFNISSYYILQLWYTNAIQKITSWWKPDITKNHIFLLGQYYASYKAAIINFFRIINLLKSAKISVKKYLCKTKKNNQL